MGLALQDLLLPSPTFCYASESQTPDPIFYRHSHPDPGRDRRLPALGSSSSLPTASSGRPRAAHRHRRVRGAAPGSRTQ